MADLTFGDQVGLSRSTTPPSHYIVKIESFSLLAKNNIEIYNSKEFEAGGYKWNLILHPNGNKNKNIDDYISLYLMMVVEGSSFRPGWEVHAIFRFFLFDQNNDSYLVIQETIKSGRRFHVLKHEWGIDRLVPLKEFKNPSNGYLVNDTCIFGAEVYVCENQFPGKGEHLSMMKDPISYTHTWKIQNFSKLNVNYEESTTFNAGDQKWKIQIYPKGYGSGAGTDISLFLCLSDPKSLPPGSQIRAEYTLRIVDQDYSAHQSFTGKRWFSSLSSNWGWARFISISDINSLNRGYLKNNCCIVEAEVIVHGVLKAL